MNIASLIAWATAALGGAYLLVTWLVHGGMRQRAARTTRFSARLILGHFGLAASGLLIWVAYVFTDIRALARAALAILVCVALLGFTMFVRWGGEEGRGGAAGTEAGKTPERPAESHFPAGVVAAHGGFAVVALILVLLATLGIGG